MSEMIRAAAKNKKPEAKRENDSKTQKKVHLNPLARLQNKSCTFKEPSATRQLEGS